MSKKVALKPDNITVNNFLKPRKTLNDRKKLIKMIAKTEQYQLPHVDYQEWERKTMQKQQRLQTTKQVFAEVMIRTSQFDYQYVYEQLKNKGISLPADDNEFYQLRLMFIRQIIRYTETIIERFINPNLQKIDHQCVKTIMRYIINCKHYFPSHLSSVMINIIKLCFQIEKVKLNKQDLVQLHKKWTQIIFERKRDTVVYNKEVLLPLLSQKRAKRRRQYFNNSAQVNRIWNPKHAQYLKKIYYCEDNLKQPYKMFQDKFPEHRQMWNRDVICLQWYKITRQAFKALQSKIKHSSGVKYMKFPKVDKNFVSSIVKPLRYKDIQLRLIKIMDEQVSHSFIQSTILMIKQARKGYDMIQVREYKNTKNSKSQASVNDHNDMVMNYSNDWKQFKDMKQDTF